MARPRSVYGADGEDEKSNGRADEGQMVSNAGQMGQMGSDGTSPRLKMSGQDARTEALQLTAAPACLCGVGEGSARRLDVTQSKSSLG